MPILGFDPELEDVGLNLFELPVERVDQLGRASSSASGINNLASAKYFGLSPAALYTKKSNTQSNFFRGRVATKSILDISNLDLELTEESLQVSSVRFAHYCYKWKMVTQVFHKKNHALSA